MANSSTKRENNRIQSNPSCRHPGASREVSGAVLSLSSQVKASW